MAPKNCRFLVNLLLSVTNLDNKQIFSILCPLPGGLAKRELL
jgi:hypothetical protein